MRISVRIPVIIVACSLVASGAIGAFAYVQASKDMRVAIESSLVSIGQSRAATLEQLLRGVREDMALIAQSRESQDALGDLNRIFGEFDRSQRGENERDLRMMFRPDQTDGDFDRMTTFKTPLYRAYFDAHQRYHSWFSLITALKGYADLFLITAQGDVVYTARKMPDFATNLFRDENRELGLSRAFREAMRTSNDAPDVFVDFSHYSPSGNEPAAFIARRIVLGNRAIGAIALQMPIKRINATMNAAIGLGTTGESYIVGDDFKMRSDPRLTTESTILEREVRSSSVEKALRGQSGKQVVTGLGGEEALSVYQPLRFLGTTWAVVAEMDMSEVLAPIEELRQHSIRIAAIVGFAVCAVGVLIAMTITRPLSKLAEAFAGFGRTREWDPSFFAHRSDEIGEFARQITRVARDLKDREIWFQSLLDSAPYATVIADSNAHIRFANDQAQRLFAYKKGEIENKLLESLVPDGNWEARIGRGEDLLRVDAADNLGVELTGRRKSGELFTAAVSLAPIQAAEGILFAIAIRDITKRKEEKAELERSRKALTEKSAVLLSVLDSIDQGLAAFDEDLRLIAWNSKFIEIREYPVEFATYGRPFADFMRHDISRSEFGGGDPERIFKFQLERAKRFERHSFERRRPDGRYVEVKGGPMAVGGFVSTYTDVTQRKSAEEELKMKEAQLQSALDNMSGGMFMVDKNLNMVLCNEMFRQYYDLPPGVVKPGQPLRQILEVRARRGEYGPGDEKELVDARIKNYRELPEGRYEDAVPGRILEIYRAPTGDGGVIATMNDITARKKAEDELASKTKTLERVSRQLSKYLSPQIYQSILSEDKEVALVTARKKLSVFFSDIKEFTSTTEEMEPEDLTFLLNDYLTEMSLIALEFGATIDKYIGDAMLMFFGDPETKGVREDALACVRMAIAMQRRMVALRQKWYSMGFKKPFHMRVGVNSGYCNVGNFGSSQRMDYTIIGGEVNLAARLEGACQPDGVLLSEETYQLVRDHIRATAMEPIQVKGIRQAITTYVVSNILAEEESDDRFIRQEAEGLRLFVDLKYLPETEKATLAERLSEIAARLRKGDTKA